MAGAFHGGGFWDAIGARFSPEMDPSSVLNLDVLDAWFDPAPAVVAAMSDRIAWQARTAPPTHAEGLVATIAETRGLPRESILVGPGSSALIYLVWSRWVTSRSRVRLDEPMYGEYRHLAEVVSGCQVEYAIGDEQDQTGEAFDLVVKVNPNNPTGRAELASDLLAKLPRSRRTVVDEAYRDYLGDSYSLERAAAQSTGLFVLKSLSKGFALSGLRVAYLVGPPAEIQALARWSPPWFVGLPAQIAAVRALAAPEYYAKRYGETKELVDELVAGMGDRGIETRAGVNWVLVRVDSANEVTQRCREIGLFIRNAGLTAPSYGDHWVRIAVPRPEMRSEFWTRFERMLKACSG
jgi:histidinol-phosphate/aromatic aminotransferase/cobyric acid decarboxylase-like protein